MLPTLVKEINLRESFPSPLTRQEHGVGNCLHFHWRLNKGRCCRSRERVELRRTSGYPENRERAQDSISSFRAVLAVRHQGFDLEEEGRSLDSMAPAGPAQRLPPESGSSPGPLPHLPAPTKSSTPSIPCSHPPSPLLLRVCGAAEVMTSPWSPGRRGRINQAEWAVAMARILPLPRRLGICSLCAARVPSPWGQGV